MSAAGRNASTAQSSTRGKEKSRAHTGRRKSESSTPPPPVDAFVHGAHIIYIVGAATGTATLLRCRPAFRSRFPSSRGSAAKGHDTTAAQHMRAERTPHTNERAASEVIYELANGRAAKTAAHATDPAVPSSACAHVRMGRARSSTSPKHTHARTHAPRQSSGTPAARSCWFWRTPGHTQRTRQRASKATRTRGRVTHSPCSEHIAEVEHNGTGTPAQRHWHTARSHTRAPRSRQVHATRQANPPTTGASQNRTTGS